MCQEAAWHRRDGGEDRQLDSNGSAGLCAVGGALIGRLRTRRRNTHGRNQRARIVRPHRLPRKWGFVVGSWFPLIPLKRVPLRAGGDTPGHGLTSPQWEASGATIAHVDFDRCVWSESERGKLREVALHTDLVHSHFGIRWNPVS